MCLALLCLSNVYAQVDEIKSASSSSRSGKSGSGDSGGYEYDEDSAGGAGVFFDFLFGGLIRSHGEKLNADRERYPSMVSFDVMLQGAVKPASYYILWPRIRGNWGLFSTDFRMNYLIEDDVEGFKHIRTNDWQVLQLNLITSQFITFRVGTGFMQEAFNTKEMFSESAFMFGIHAPDQSKSINFEFRFAVDLELDVNPRNEFSAYYQHQLFHSGKLHGYATVGGVYQKYYDVVDVWGVQAGLVFRFF